MTRWAASLRRRLVLVVIVDGADGEAGTWRGASCHLRRWEEDTCEVEATGDRSMEGSSKLADHRLLPRRHWPPTTPTQRNLHCLTWRACRLLARHVSTHAPHRAGGPPRHVAARTPAWTAYICRPAARSMQLAVGSSSSTSDPASQSISLTSPAASEAASYHHRQPGSHVDGEGGGAGGRAAPAAHCRRAYVVVVSSRPR